MATLNGGEGNDTITGTSGSDIINGRDGNDQISGGDGADTVDAGVGSDLIAGSVGDDNLNGGDWIDGDSDTIYGGAGSDIIFVRSHGIVSGNTGSASVFGDAGDDNIRSLGNFSIIDAGGGNDVIDIGWVDMLHILPGELNVLSGGEGVDRLVVEMDSLENSEDFFRIISQIEILDLSNATEAHPAIILDGMTEVGGTLFVVSGDYGFEDGSAHFVDASNVTSFSLNIRLSVFGVGLGGARADFIEVVNQFEYGSASLYGGAGDDTLLGGRRSDTVVGGSGDDMLLGGDGSDTAVFFGNSANYSIVEITYNTFRVIDNVGADGVDTIVDVNRLEFADQTIDIVIRGIEIIGDETDEALSGGSSADHVDGAGGDDTLSGLGGHDSIDGGDGFDTLVGNVGNDFLNGDAGNDSISGGAGNDSVDGGVGNDTLYSADGDDTVLGGDGSDLIVGGDGEGNDRYVGGAGSDTIKYTSALNSIYINLATGFAGSVGDGDLAGIGSDRLSSIENVISGRYSDRITGNGSANTLNAGAGNDTIDGGAGKDQLTGGIGRDVMTGGTSGDSFVFSHVNQSSTTNSTCDVIKDFVHGVDKINLRAIDAFSGTTSTNENFKWNTGPSFSNTSQGEVRFKQFNNDGTGNDYTMIYIDTDGDVGAEMLIRLTGLHNLTASDFIL